MLIIGRGTNPNVNNEVTIRLDKTVLADLDRRRHVDGYPPEQERAMAQMRERVETYEAQYGVVKV